MVTVERALNDESGKLKSPLPKLVRFFSSSRDKWKAKHANLKQQCKLLSNQVRAVEKSREKWREDALEAQRELRHLRQELEETKKAPGRR
jgi:hypothetical protein